MKKIIITALLFGFGCTHAVFASDFAAAMSLYKSGDYEKAKIEFRDLVSKNSSDVNSRYMYAQTLIKTKEFEKARQEYEFIVSVSPNSRAGQLSSKGIKILDGYQNELSSESPYSDTDYIENAFKNGQRHVWGTNDVAVYVQNHKLKPVVFDALNEWSKAIGGVLTFSEVTSKDDAQINVYFTKDTVFPENTSMENGSVSFDYSGKELTSCTVTVNTIKENGRIAEILEMRPIMLHLIGHAIGIDGHSPVAGDVMSKGSPEPVQRLSRRDKNTAAKLYDGFSGIKVSLEQSQNAKIKSAQAALERAPDSAEALAELAEATAESGNPATALIYYKKALLIEETADVYKKMADIYRSMGRTDEETICALSILKLEPDNIIALENVIENYINQNRYTEARTVLDDFLGANPDLSNDKTVVELRRFLNNKKIQYINKKQKAFRNIKY